MKNANVKSDVEVAKNHYDAALMSGNGVATMKTRLMNTLFNNVDDIIEMFTLEQKVAEAQAEAERLREENKVLSEALEEADRENDRLRKPGGKK